jgi:hypothetical protein
MAWLRVKTDSGKVVEITGFRHSRIHLEILRAIQVAAETVFLRCTFEGQPSAVCVAFLRLTDSELRPLNPNPSGREQ